MWGKLIGLTRMWEFWIQAVVGFVAWWVLTLFFSRVLHWSGVEALRASRIGAIIALVLVLGGMFFYTWSLWTGKPLRALLFGF